MASMGWCLLQGSLTNVGMIPARAHTAGMQKWSCVVTTDLAHKLCTLS